MRAFSVFHRISCWSAIDSCSGASAFFSSATLQVLWIPEVSANGSLSIVVDSTCSFLTAALEECAVTAMLSVKGHAIVSDEGDGSGVLFPRPGGAVRFRT